MEFFLIKVPFNASNFQVTKAFEDVLHGPDLFDPKDKTWFKGRPPNFRVFLNPRTAGGVGHSGTGKLTVHSEAFGKSCQRWFRTEGNEVRVNGSNKKISISWGRATKPDPILAKAIYVGKS